MGKHVTDSGFSKPSLLDNNESFGDALKGAMGDSLDTGETTPAGLLVGMLAKTVSDAEDVDQEIYTAADPGAATGVALDRLCAMIGVSRIDAAGARCEVVCYTNGANEGLIVNPGKQVRRVRGGLVFSLPTAFAISYSACREIYLTLATAAPADVIELDTTLATVSHTVVSSTNPIGETYDAIVAAFNAAQTTAVAQRRLAGDPLNLLNVDCVVITSPLVAFGYTPTTWAVGLLGSSSMFIANPSGYQSVAVGEVTEIVTPQANWLYCRNLKAGIAGRAVETDEELRLRRERSFRVGYATDDAIRQSLLDRVVGILSANVVSNRKLSVDSEGRPPKSFEAIVDGGFDDDIALVIWQSQPAGIESYAPSPPAPTGGYATIDSQGHTQYVKFSRPEQAPLDIRITYSLYSEEQFPGEAAVKEALVAWGVEEYVLGKDVIKGRIEGAIYSSVPGINSLLAEVRWHGDPTWVTTPLAVSARRRAVVLAANISLVSV